MTPEYFLFSIALMATAAWEVEPPRIGPKEATDLGRGVPQPAAQHRHQRLHLLDGPDRAGEGHAPYQIVARRGELHLSLESARARVGHVRPRDCAGQRCPRLIHARLDRVVDTVAEGHLLHDHRGVPRLAHTFDRAEAPCAIP